MRATIMRFIAMAVIAMMIALPATASRIGGTNGIESCYRSGSMWYCARYDNASFYAPCAGTVPAPHLNVEAYQGTSSLKTALVYNWHVGWKQVGSAQCLIAYESRLGRCEKICYGSKSGQAGDLLSRIGFPSGMKYDYDVSSEFQKLYISNGTSPYMQVIYTAAGVFLVAAVSWAAVAWIITAIIASVGR